MQKMGKKVGVIGAGPAGIISSIIAAKSGWQVFLFDSNPGVGRKLLVTGGGRCNITNAKIHEDAFYTHDKSFVKTALQNFGRTDLINLLDQLGIPLYSTDDGWYYPISNSAGNVVDILDAVLDEHGVNKILNTAIVRISQDQGRYHLVCSEQEKTFRVDKLIIASGGKAYPTLGSKGELFEILKDLGHTILPIKPALAPIKTDMGSIHTLQGVRLDVTATLIQKERVLGEATGNMIFTSWGVNGPAVMDISHLVNLNNHADMFLKLNFLNKREALLKKVILENRHKKLPVKTLLESILPEKICVHSLKQAKINKKEYISDISESRLDNLFVVLKNVLVKVKGTRDFQFSQVSTGGVDVREVNPQTMESRIVRGLYFAGEVLDVIGPCGGFNLQWAFTSGAIAGRLSY